MPQRSQRPTRAQSQSVEERNAEIVRRYEIGETLASIGLSRGLTRERVRQIVKLAGGSRPTVPSRTDERFIRVAPCAA